MQPGQGLLRRQCRPWVAQGLLSVDAWLRVLGAPLVPRRHLRLCHGDCRGVCCLLCRLLTLHAQEHCLLATLAVEGAENLVQLRAVLV